MRMTRAEFEALKKRTPKLVVESATPPANSVDERLHIVIAGQIKGGKNNMVVTRDGKHFPKREWAKWRDEAVEQVKAQLHRNHVPFSKPVLVTFGYYAGDKRRRDEPAIKDAVWHVLERAGVVHDDCLLWTTHSWRNYDKQNPRVELWFAEDKQ